MFRIANNLNKFFEVTIPDTLFFTVD